MSLAPRHDLWGREARIDVERDLRFRDIRLQAVTSLDYSAAGARQGPQLGYWSPAAGAAMTVPCGNAECFGLVRRQPLTLTRDVSEFLSPKGSVSHTPLER